MAPKQEISKKAKKERVEKSIEDQTFGLKNKNKSNKVQKFVDGVNRTVKNNTVALNKDAVIFIDN